MSVRNGKGGNRFRPYKSDDRLPSVQCTTVSDNQATVYTTVLFLFLQILEITMKTNLIHLILLLTVSPLIFGEIFIDNGVNCFNACMKCFMMGLSCQPHRPLPSGSQFCLFECMVTEQRLPGSNVYEIINTIHICRKTYSHDTPELDNCQKENLKLWYPDSHSKFLRTNVSGVSAKRR